jgi:hypothetical protein
VKPLVLFEEIISDLPPIFWLSY